MTPLQPSLSRPVVQGVCYMPVPCQTCAVLRLCQLSFVNGHLSLTLSKLSLYEVSVLSHQPGRALSFSTVKSPMAPGTHDNKFGIFVARVKIWVMRLEINGPLPIGIFAIAQRLVSHATALTDPTNIFLRRRRLRLPVLPIPFAIAHN